MRLLEPPLSNNVVMEVTKISDTTLIDDPGRKLWLIVTNYQKLFDASNTVGWLNF